MRIKEAIIVEGIYDKIRLDSIVDALIVPTYGFSLFTDPERLAYIRMLAEKTGIIILTDSDYAGQKIRDYLSENIRTGLVLHAFIPAVPGKEKRKDAPSSAGTLGVEGMKSETLLRVLREAATVPCEKTRAITSSDLYRDGFIGGAESRKRRSLLLAHLGLPPKLSSKALLKALNVLLSPEEYHEWVQSEFFSKKA